jgi:hypothetical protein
MYDWKPTTQWPRALGAPPVATGPVRKFSRTAEQVEKVNQILKSSLSAEDLRAKVEEAVSGGIQLANGVVAATGPKQAALFEAVFGVSPSWHPAGANWLLGGVVRKRMELAAKLLSGGSIRYQCFGSELQPDDPTKYFVRAEGEQYRIGLGARFWESVRDGDRESADLAMLAAALKIAFGDLIRFAAGAATKNQAYCYVRYALHLADRKIPVWVASGCPIPPDRWNRLMRSAPAEPQLPI